MFTKLIFIAHVIVCCLKFFKPNDPKPLEYTNKIVGEWRVVCRNLLRRERERKRERERANLELS